MIFDTSEYQKLSPEQQEAVKEQLGHMASACSKIGVLANDANFDLIYEELCRGRYSENEGMLFSEADYFYAAHNIKERLEVDEALQRRQEREAAAKELARQQERAARLRQKDMEAGLNPHNHMSEEQRQAEAEQAAKNLETFKEARRKELQDAQVKAALEAATQKDIQDNPGRYCPSHEGDGADPAVLRKLPNNVLRLYMKRRQEYERQLEVEANEAKKRKQ